MARSMAAPVGQASPGPTLTETGGKLAAKAAANVAVKEGAARAAAHSMGAEIHYARGAEEDRLPDQSTSADVKRPGKASRVKTFAADFGRVGLSMTTEVNRQAYHRRIQQVVGYICSHLDDDLSVDKLSAVAGFSNFPFHRQFTEYTGFAAAEFVRLSRLKRAAY